jgi:hypothetical protein
MGQYVVNIRMKEIIRAILHATPRKSRKTMLTPEMRKFLDDEYPTTDFPYQCELVMSDDPIPKCPVCGKLPARRKITCSRECREQLKKDSGIDSFAAAKQTMQEKYGVDNAAQVPAYQRKRINTMVDTYGAKVSDKTRRKAKQRADDLNTKGRETIKTRYGVDNPSQIDGHKNKVKQTLMSNYGVENFFHSTEWKDRVATRKKDTLNDLVNDVVSILQISQPDFDLLSSYDKPNDRVSFKCKTCGNEETLPTETLKYRIRQMQTPCSSCSNISGKGSHSEKAIAAWVRDELGLNVVENDRTIIAPMELDIVLPDKNIAIEYCGLYWHNDQRIDKDYHDKKRKMCQARGYNLITIFEDEWVHKPDIVKNRLRSKLGKVTNRVGARKCSIVCLDSKTASNFINETHIQGYINASVRYGLEYDGELVAVMTFVRGNVSKKVTGWELSRFSIKGDYSIPGAANKLFKKFREDHDPTEVTTFSDLRWNTGDVYVEMGFDMIGHTGLNYWYISKDTRIHRFNLRKKSNEPDNISETDLRRAQGWLRIWDCGNNKYVWSKKS